MNSGVVNNDMYNHFYIVNKVDGINNVGGVIGFNDGGNVNFWGIDLGLNLDGVSNVGGVVGLNNSNVYINWAALYGYISGDTNVGKVAGWNKGVIKADYLHLTDLSTSAESNVGNSAGLNEGQIIISD